MHRTTIVRNKIISIICNYLFFCLANIYRPSLGKVRLGKPNQTQQGLNFYLWKKKNYTQNCMHYNASLPNFQFKKKNNNFYQKTYLIFNYRQTSANTISIKTNSI